MLSHVPPFPCLGSLAFCLGSLANPLSPRDCRFPLDITCILVSVFDYISLMPKEPGQSSNLESLKVLRTLRALRLIKLIRLMRASRMAKHWEVRVSVNYSLLAMSKCVFGMILLSHFFACVWGLQTSFSPRIEDTSTGSTSQMCCTPSASAVLITAL